MFNLASSLLYNSLFQQNNNGEHEYKENVHHMSAMYIHAVHSIHWFVSNFLPKKSKFQKTKIFEEKYLGFFIKMAQNIFQKI